MTRTIGPSAQLDLDDYLSRCEEHLDDLPTGTRLSLLHDINEIIQEISTELDGRPDDLIGDPATFVCELRRTSGHPPPAEPQPARSRSRSIRDTVGNARSRIEHRALPWFLRLARDLRPAWWVARGIGFAIVFDLGHINNGNGFIPAIAGSSALWVAVAGLCVFGSVEVGRKPPTQPWMRLAVVAMGIVAIGATVNDIDNVRDGRFEGWDAWAASSGAAVISGPLDELTTPRHIQVVDVTSGDLVLDMGASYYDIVDVLEDLGLEDATAHDFLVSVEGMDGPQRLRGWEAVRTTIVEHFIDRMEFATINDMGRSSPES